MTKDVGTNTLVALQGARVSGLKIRDFLTVRAKNRSTGEQEELNVWNGDVAITAPVTDPATGDSTNRDFQAMGSILGIPPIPAGIATEVRSIRVTLSHLSNAVLTIMRTYNAKMAPIEIHRGIFDPDTGRLVDPALCRFVGYVNNAPIKTPKPSNVGTVEAECVSNSRILTKIAGTLFSDETLKKRSSDRFGKYLDVSGAWRIWWGQEEKAISEKAKLKERYLR